jgi:hypothetical protein
MNFLDRHSLYKHEKPYFLIYEPPNDFPKSNIKLDRHADLKIHDIRGQEDCLSFKRQGCQIVKISSQLSYEDFAKADLVKDVFLPEVAAKVQELFGATKVQIFEHLLRRRHDIFPISTGKAYEFNQPTSIAHIGK